MRKLMLLAAMLAMVLAVAVPATAQMANTGNSQNVQSFFESGTTGDDVGTGGDVSSEVACHDEIVDSLASERGIATDEDAELLERVRESASAEQFDELVKHFCNQ